MSLEGGLMFIHHLNIKMNGKLLTTSNRIDKKVRVLAMVMRTFKNWSLGKKLFGGVAALLVMALIFTSCGSNKAMDNADYAPEAAYDSLPLPAPQEGGVGNDQSKEVSTDSASTAAMSGRKLIKDGEVSLETLSFEESLTTLNQLIEDVGGFSETRTIQGKSMNYQGLRSAFYVIRVPAERFEWVMNSMGSIGTVLESGDKGTDITDQYMDFETRVKTLRVQEQTLLDLMAKATKLEDVITLESRITEVRYEIESIENTLKNYDRLVSFSRITINLQEVTERIETKPVPKTLGERISSSFNQSLEDFRDGVEDFLVWLAGSWINLLFMALLAIGVLWALKKRKKIRRKAQALPQQTQEEPKE